MTRARNVLNSGEPLTLRRVESGARSKNVRAYARKALGDLTGFE